MNAHMNRLPQLREDLKRLEAEIEKLKRQSTDYTDESA
jgi:hypothetical protein